MPYFLRRENFQIRLYARYCRKNARDRSYSNEEPARITCFNLREFSRRFQPRRFFEISKIFVSRSNLIPRNRRKGKKKKERRFEKKAKKGGHDVLKLFFFFFLIFFQDTRIYTFFFNFLLHSFLLLLLLPLLRITYTGHSYCINVNIFNRIRGN